MTQAATAATPDPQPALLGQGLNLCSSAPKMPLILLHPEPFPLFLCLSLTITASMPRPLLRLGKHLKFLGYCLDSSPNPVPPDFSPSDLCPAGVVLEAVAWLAGGTVYRGETASLLCNISVRGGPPGLRLAASWWVERPEEGELSSGHAQLVGGVGKDGVAELGVRPGGGPVSVELLGPRSHRLRLHSLEPEDEGVYHCAPSAWVQHADYSWYQAGSARSGPVTVYPYTHGE